jgi:hypothetical protein
MVLMVTVTISRKSTDLFRIKSFEKVKLKSELSIIIKAGNSIPDNCFIFGCCQRLNNHYFLTNNFKKMKKHLLKVMYVVLALVALQLQVMAGSNASVSSLSAEDESLVSFNESEIYGSFTEIEGLVNYVNQNENATYADLKTNNSSLIDNVSASSALAMNVAGNGTPPVISAFLWGCLFSWVGIIVVYITTDGDSAQIKKSAFGCVVSGLAYILFYVVVYGAAWGASSGL